MKHLSIFLSFVLLLSLFTGCKSDEPEQVEEPSQFSLVPEPKCQSTLLIYSVAANNLQPILRNDSIEMTQAAPEIEGLAKNYKVILYLAPKQGVPTLSELKVDKDNKGYFQLMKTYERDIPSTHPARMKQVWQDVKTYRPAATYSMMLESHGSGWTPYFCEHPTPNNGDGTTAYAFGSDQTLGYKDRMDILELAEALKDTKLDFIWFDACYMAGIETIYQLRDTANYFVGYVTEIDGEGVPYNLVLQKIAGSSANLVEAAKIVFDTYNQVDRAVSISIIDLSKMSGLAAATRPFATVEEITYATFLQNYARLPDGPFYDFGQYINRVSDSVLFPDNDIAAFNQALDEAVIFKAISAKDFRGFTVDQEAYSGISTHIPGQPTTVPANEEYWFQTDWAHDVYPTPNTQK